MTNVKVVSAGGAHTVSIKKDSTLWAWGYNASGQLGNGTTIERTSPVQIGIENTWVWITAGQFHTLGIKSNGTLWAWGSNNSGQLGIGSFNSVFKTPVLIDSLNKWKLVSAGGDHTLALKNDGTLWAWGLNNFGQLGIGFVNGINNSPIQVGSSNDWRNVTAGNDYSFGIKNDGTLWAWGNNEYGKLGIGNNIDQKVPTQIGHDTDWHWIQAGGDHGGHAVALKTDSSMWSWGYNFYGQLGDGTTTNRYDPVQIGIDKNWVQVEAGDRYSLGLKSDGTLWSWGDNAYYQLGIRIVSNNKIPSQIICVPTNIENAFSIYENLQIFPTITKDHLEVKMNNSEVPELTLEIRNVLGEEIYPREIFKNNIKIELNEFANGIYFIIIRNKIAVISKQFIKL